MHSDNVVFRVWHIKKCKSCKIYCTIYNDMIASSERQSGGACLYGLALHQGQACWSRYECGPLMKEQPYEESMQQVFLGSGLVSWGEGFIPSAAACPAPTHMRLERPDSGGSQPVWSSKYINLFPALVSPTRSRTFLERSVVSGGRCLEPAVSAQPGIGSVRWVSLAKTIPPSFQPPAALIIMTPHPPPHQSWLTWIQES